MDRYPGPACCYEFVDDRPVVVSTNDSFERRFGRDVTGTAVANMFETLGLQFKDSSPVAARLSRGDQFRVRAGEGQEDGAYLVQTVPPKDGMAGMLLFVELPGYSDSPGGQLGVDHVASVVSHDLRNPLDVAKARLKAGRELDEDTHFEHVACAHERMERIIQDVLTIARGEEVVNPDDRVDLTAVAETAWETVDTDTATVRIAALPTVTADPDRIGRLFENLFRNCVEHGVEHGGHDDATLNRRKPQSAVTVTVGRLEGDDTDGFYVADDGPGIPPEARGDCSTPGTVRTTMAPVSGWLSWLASPTCTAGPSTPHRPRQVAHASKSAASNRCDGAVAVALNSDSRRARRG